VQGLHVTALDYSDRAIAEVLRRAASWAVAANVTALRHDLRKPLPFSTESFDAVYSHMALCMDFSEADLAGIFSEIRRVLKSGGLNVYTVRSTRDADYGLGRHVGENIYEVDGYAIHFFDRNMVERFAREDRLIAVEEISEGEKQLLWVATRTKR